MMWENITWGTYFSIVATSVLIYYFFIGLICYRQEIYRFIKTGQSRLQQQQASAPPAAQTEYNGLEPVVADLKGILEKAGKGAEKYALLPLLTQRLSSYGGLKHPAFRIALINYIIRNAEGICDITFTEKELEDALKDIAG